MAKFQLLECNIALAGDILNVVARHAYNPVTYPELLVLQYIHGETAVTDIFDCGVSERDEGAEYQRLMGTYGGALIRERLFPGAGTRLPTSDSKFKPRTKRQDAAPNIPDLPTPDHVTEPGVDVQGTGGTTPATRNSSLPGPDAQPEPIHDVGQPAEPPSSTTSAVAANNTVNPDDVRAVSATDPNSPPQTRTPRVSEGPDATGATGNNDDSNATDDNPSTGGRRSSRKS